MAEIHITREHGLGLAEARELALRFAQAAQDKLEMQCHYEEGAAEDLLRFQRSGAHGALKVTPERFVLHAKLGMLLGMFRERIESEIAKNLDKLLAEKAKLRIS